MPLLLLLLLAIALPGPVSAQTRDSREVNQTCLIDGNTAPDGRYYRSCEAESHNDELIENVFKSARLVQLSQKTKHEIWVHGVCKFIDSRNLASDTFIPFASAMEWQMFLQNMPSTLVAARCCEPKPVRATDILTPSQPCAGGWHLQGIVADGGDGPFILAPTANGALIGQDGKEVEYPLLRDDENAVFEFAGTTQFAARFQCGGAASTNVNDPTPPTQGVLVPDHPEEGITVIGNPPPAKAGEIIMTPFQAKCNNATWRMISVRPCNPSEHTMTASCEAHGFPAGTPGEVVIRVSFTCPGEERVEDVVGSTCQPVSQPQPARP